MSGIIHAIHALSAPLVWIIASLCAVCLGGCGKSSNEAPPPESASYWLKSSRTAPRTAIVFVHGVMGDSRATWLAPNGATGWPELMEKDPELPSVDVLALGYRSPPIGRASNIEEIAVRSLGAIKDAGLFARYDNVIFVAHSMGGLVTKRLLKTLQGEDRAAFDKVRAVVFFATPANGSNIAAMAEWMSSNPQFRDMAPADFSSFLQVLENDWQALLRSRSPTAPFPRSYCAYETLPAHGMKVVVPRSAAQGRCDETPIAFDRDHASIVKPTSLEDEVHRYLRARILASLDPKLIPQQVTVKVTKASGEALQAGSVMNTRDQYSIQLEATRGAWFYIYGVDSSARVQRLFPSPAAGTQSATVKALRVPQNEAGFFTLDKRKGIERLYIFARTEPDAQLAELGVALANRPRDNQATGAELDRYFMSSRGVGSVEPRRPDPSGVTLVPAVLGGATEVIMFEHR
jgi:pimeloyl-ACP methyl ester carboxylesterase